MVEKGSEKKGIKANLKKKHNLVLPARTSQDANSKFEIPKSCTIEINRKCFNGENKK